MTRLEMKIDGMSCGHCVGAVRKALQSLPGVEIGDVAIGSAQVSYDESRTSPEAITRAVEEEGYPVRKAS